MHTNTRLTVHSRYWMIRQYEQGVPVKVLAEQYHISHATFYRWLKRYWKEGYEGLMNRSSRPQKIHYRLTPVEELRLEELRLSHRWGPARLGNQMGVSSITVYRHLLRSGMNRLPRPPRAAVVRYEMSAPGELVHLDIMYLFALRGKRRSTSSAWWMAIRVWRMLSLLPTRALRLPCRLSERHKSISVFPSSGSSQTTMWPSPGPLGAAGRLPREASPALPERFRSGGSVTPQPG